MHTPTDLDGYPITVEDISHKLNISGEKAQIYAVAPQLLEALEWDMHQGHTSACPAGWSKVRKCSARCIAARAAIAAIEETG